MLNKKTPRNFFLYFKDRDNNSPPPETKRPCLRSLPIGHFQFLANIHENLATNTSIPSKIFLIHFSLSEMISNSIGNKNFPEVNFVEWFFLKNSSLIL